jgi:hypothetical protein
MGKGTTPGFALGQVVRNPELHRWTLVGTVPQAAAVAWVQEVSTAGKTFDLDSWSPSSGIYISVSDRLMLYRNAKGFQLFRWRQPV